MIVTLRYVRLMLSYAFFAFSLFLAFNQQTATYIIRQGWGQLKILVNTVEETEYMQLANPSQQETENLMLIAAVKKYSVDSLGFNATESYRKIYDQAGKPLLWVITASEPYELKAYKWNFPIIGRVSYKGFFKEDLAKREYNHFKSAGYDVEMRSVSAWSTLGWLPDPILSNMLKRSKGSVCNLVFHELFHATYYAPSSVDFNENIASFVADKATRQFLANDTVALNDYVRSQEQTKLYRNFALRKAEELRKFYQTNHNQPGKQLLKLRFFNQIIDSVKLLQLSKSRRDQAIKNIFEFKNAYFISFHQYDRLQDSLDFVFNKFYEGRLKKMVHDLKHKQSNY